MADYGRDALIDKVHVGTTQRRDVSTHDDFRYDPAKAKNDFDARTRAYELARASAGPGESITATLTRAAAIEKYLQTGKAN